jgi:RNase P protein component
MNAIVYPPSMPVPSGADAMTAASLSIDTHAPMVRFGFTVSRRQARRAVVRNGVKRVLRESARHAATALAECASGRPVDILVRLKAPLPDPASASWGTVKRQIRREADSLIGQLREHLLASGPMSGRP